MLDFYGFLAMVALIAASLMTYVTALLLLVRAFKIFKH